MYTLIRRLSVSEVTFGRLLDESGNLLCYTLELPWDQNNHDTSCIPIGTYKCITHDSLAHPHTWEITGVPNRSAILIHEGNTAENSKGCVLVGTTTGSLEGSPAVLNSKLALEKLRATLPDNFSLTIKGEDNEFMD